MEKPWHRRSKGGGNNRCDRTDINIIALARKIGLSMVELDLLSMQDFFDLIYAYMGDDPNDPRMATQEDIDAFYRG